MTTNINRALLDTPRRAETVDPGILAATFVDTGPIFHLLQSRNHQIIYGRRGTGKTHAFKYLAENLARAESTPIYIDLRTVGSNSAIYGDSTLPITERATRLILDVLGAIQDQILDYVVRTDHLANTNEMLALLQQLADEIIASVRVSGTMETERVEETGLKKGRGVEAGLAVSPAPGIHLKAGRNKTETESNSIKVTESGVAQHRVSFGSLALILSKIATASDPRSFWILLDEWSSVPTVLQPHLADMIKRAILPTRGFIVKIAAIEQRSSFRVFDGKESIGFELGADIAADLDLDDILVFGNDEERATSFFQNLLYKHVLSYCNENGLVTDVPTSSEDFVSRAFVWKRGFAELVRAAEGVPRDAINIASLCALEADNSKIEMNTVRKAARTWYQRDKSSAVATNPASQKLLNWIIDEVIAKRKARGFLLQQGKESEHRLIGELYDARVIHVIKKGIASKDQTGVRYNVFLIDYGAYVELISTASAPKGLFEAETASGNEWIEVPADDYRSLRRAILDLKLFESSNS